MHVLNILWVVFGIGLMLVLNLKFKINSMVALLVAALSVGMLAGMDLMSLLHTMKMCIRDRCRVDITTTETCMSFVYFSFYYRKIYLFF